MTAVTINLPDQLARYATEQDKTRPGWLETLVRRAKRTAKPAAARTAAPSPFDRALEIYKRGTASIAGAAKLGEVDRFDFERYLVDIHYPIPQQTAEEVHADAEDIRQILEAKRKRAAVCL